MRFLASFVLAIVLSLSAHAQGDFGLYGQGVKHSQSRLIPWLVYENSDQNWYIDTRFDFDWSNSWTAFFGTKLDAGFIVFQPAIGFTVGQYRGIAAQCYVSPTLPKQFSVVTLWEASKSYNGQPCFLYHWGTYLYTVSEYFRVGFDEQVFFDDAERVTYTDIGPVVKMFYHDYYIKLWYAHNNQGYNKYLIGLGKTF